VTEESFKRKLTAILSADVEGYSRLMGEDEDATIRTLTAYRELMSALIQKHRGRVVDSPGDNLLAEFLSVVDAVRCAVEVQEELRVRNAELPENRRMEFRIGINLGDVVEEGERIYGDGINIAARVEGIAEGGGICISGTVYDSIKNKLSLSYESLGEHTVKNIKEPIRVYRMRIGPEAAAPVVREEKAGQRRWQRAGLVAVAALAVAVGAWAIWNFYFRPPPIEPASVDRMAYPLPDKPSIAVLPFVNMSGDPEQEFLADGITENIISALSTVPKIFVISRNSTFTFKGKPVKVQHVAEELGVRYVLEGSVQKSGNRLRITAQLIDAINGHHLWSERYDRELKDIFTLQDEITMKIITALEVKLTQGERARLVAKGTENLEAFIKYRQATEPFYTVTKEGNVLARRLLEEVVALDPKFPAAYALLGATYFMDVPLGISKSPKESHRKAFELTKKAITLDESFATAYPLLGWLYVLREKNYDKAIAECKRALNLAPNLDAAHIWMGIILTFSGRHQEAIQYCEQALRLNPIPPGWVFRALGWSYFGAGRYEEAIAAYKKALARAPKDILTHEALTTAYSCAGRLEEARAQAAELLRINPNYALGPRAKRVQYKYQKDRDHYLDGLRKAGLPEKPPLPLPDKPSIAVLPFVNMSDDPKQEYFSDGITEEIITALSKTSNLFVIARNSMFTYKGKSVWVPTVGKELGVKYVLEGSVRKAGGKVRVTAQLTDAQTNNHIWAERYDRNLKDIFAIQDEITKNIITSIQIKLTRGEQAALSAEGTKNLDAYLCLLQAWDRLRHFNKEDNMKARRLAEKTIALDPDYDKGYSLLASVEIYDVWTGASKSPKEALMRCIELAKKSIAIRDSPVPHRVLAMTYLLFRKHSAAIKEALRAIEMAPNYADAYSALGLIYMLSDMQEEAVLALQKAMRLNPYPPSAYYDTLAWSYYWLGKYDEAISKGKKAISMNPKDFNPHLCLICSYLSMGRGEEARAHAAEILRIDPNFSVNKAERTVPLKNKDKLKIIIEQYRMAGLPD